MSRDRGDRLSRLSTSWDLVRQAHDGDAEAAVAAQRLLLERYGPAVRRYLLAMLRDAELADELAQEFAVSLLRGGLKRAQPARGRFRNYVKAVLVHLVSNYRRRLRRTPVAGHTAAIEAIAPDATDVEFVSAWRQQLLERTWHALAQAQPAAYCVLRCKLEHPELRSPQMVAPLAQALGRSLTADGVRQALCRARERFGDLLVDEVARSVESATSAAVAEELGELGLLSYCKGALERYEARSG